MFFTCVLGDDTPNYMRDAVSSAELVGTHVKDQTGLGGPNSLKSVCISFRVERASVQLVLILGLLLQTSSAILSHPQLSSGILNHSQPFSAIPSHPHGCKTLALLI